MHNPRKRRGARGRASSQVDPKEQWTLHVDGLSNSFESGARLILAYTEREVFEYALRLNLSIINNEAKFKALITRLKIVKELGVGHLVSSVTLS